MKQAQKMKRAQETTLDIFQSRLEEKIERALDEKGMTQKEIAKRININEKTLSAYVNGKRLPDVDSLKKIAKYFNCTTDYLAGLTKTGTIDTEVRAICDYTGLSSQAVEIMHEYNDSKVADSMLSLINTLIEQLYWPFLTSEKYNRVNGYDQFDYGDKLTPPPFPEMSDEELEASYKEYEAIKDRDTINVLTSAMNGDSILQLLHSYLFTSADDTLYYIDETGRIHGQMRDEPFDPNATIFLNGRVIAERYFLDAITEELRKMKAEKQATNK